MLAPMVLASSIGLGGLKKPLITAFSLGLNGNALTVSNALHNELLEENAAAFDQALTMKALIEQRKTNNLPQLVFATVCPYSCHNLQLRYWLASFGIEPDTDIKTVILPHSQMLNHPKLQSIQAIFSWSP